MALNPSIPKSTREQIKLRQQKLNLSNSLSDADIVYRNNRYPFIRLTSGINISNDNIITNLGLKGLVTSGNNLAKKYKLFSARFQTPSGVDKDNNPTFTEEFTSRIGYSFSPPTSYGFTSNESFGFSPPPGITNISIKTLNKGGVRTADINLIAHNIAQFNIINALYLKLRYCMLLEWGHNIYYDNNGNFVNNSIDLSKTFLDSSTNLSDVLTNIEVEQTNSCGNYDALVGVVKNFTWNMTPEGSYQIKIELISTGDIAESIQINTALSFKKDNEKGAGISDSQWLNPIIYNRSSLDRILKRIEAETSWHGSLSGGANLSTKNIATKTGIDWSFIKTGGDLTDSNETYKIPFSNLEYDNNNAPVGQYYIKLGSLLRIMESFLLEYNTSKSPSPPTIFLDYDYDNNFCFTLNNQTSLDPTVCLIPLKLENVGGLATKKYLKQTITYVFTSKKTKIPGGLNINAQIIEPDVYEEGWVVSSSVTAATATDSLSGDLNKEYYSGEEITTPVVNFFINKGLISDVGFAEIPKSFTTISKTIVNPTSAALSNFGILKNLDNKFRGTGDPFKGKLMHILVNMNFIHKTIEGSINVSDGKLSLTEFLNSLLDGLQGALGYINDFTLSYNHANNSLRILDNTYLSNLYDKIDPTVFNINTLTKDEGSFILDYSIKSDVFSKQGNALLAGSQTNGNTGVSNGTMFAELYKGTTDRVLTTKQNRNTPQDTTAASAQLPFLYERYKQYRLKLTENTLGGETLSLSKEDVNSLKDSIKDYYRFEMGVFSVNNKITGDRLIPLNLQLTMDGLSGLDIHQIFAVNSLALPSDYVGNVGFVIRELTHKVDENGWTTSVGSLSVLKKTTVPITDLDIISAVGDNKTKFTEFERIIEAPKKDGKKDETKATKCEGPPATEIGPADGVYLGAEEAPDDSGKYFVDVSKTINSNSLKTLLSINGCIWPIKLYTKPGDTSGVIYSKVVDKWGARNLYEPNSAFDINLKKWTYTGATGFTKTATINKAWGETLTQMARSLDGVGLWNDVAIKQWSPSIARRDVTPSSGIVHGQISAHAFGMAIDINYEDYPLGSGGVAAWDTDFAAGIDTAKVHDHINNNFVLAQNGDDKVFWLKDTGDAHHFSVHIKV